MFVTPFRRREQGISSMIEAKRTPYPEIPVTKQYIKKFSYDKTEQ